MEETTGEEADETEKDPLFMNIDKIAKLPMASKRPTKIRTTETMSMEDRSDSPDHTKES